MTFSELFVGTDVKTGERLDKLPVSGISYDTRTLQSGDVYFALGGSQSDGAAYIAEAEKKGAAACVTEKTVQGLRIPQLQTGNARRTLAIAYANFCGNPQKKLRVIGVTGTNGKTSTAYMLKTILSHSGYKTALLGTVTCEIGDDVYTPKLGNTALEHFRTMTTPDPDILYPILREMAERGVEILVMETSSHALALDKLAPISFEMGIFTNLSQEHLDFHGTMDAYLAAKKRLFENCRIGIFNIDDPYAAQMMADVPCKKIGFGVKNHTDCYAEQIRMDGALGSAYTFHSKNARFRIKTGIPGQFTIYNTLAAACAARALSVDLVNIQNALYALNGVCGRLERVDPGFGGCAFTVFIDYAHTPFAMENLLRSVNGFRSADQRIVTLFGCGGDRDREKRPMMGRIAAQMSDFVILTNDNPRTEDPSAILADIQSGMENAENYTVIEDRRAAIEFAVMNAVEGDILLLVGKGHEAYEIDRQGVHPFSEKEIVKTVLQKRNGFV